MMLDPKRTFDELDRAPRARRRDARRHPRQPDLPAALERGRGVAGVHGGRQALRARPLRALRRASCSTRRRRATRWTSSTRPDRLTGFLEGRALRRVPRADRAGREGRRPRERASSSAVLRRVTGVDLLDDLSVFFRSLSGVLDGFTRARRRRQGAARRPGDDVPHRHLARARGGRGGDLLPRQAARARMPFGGLVVNRVHPLATAAGRRRRRRARRPSWAATRSWRRKVARAYAEERGARRARRGARSSGCARGPATRTRSSSRSSTATCTTSTGSWRSTAPVRGLRRAAPRARPASQPLRNRLGSGPWRATPGTTRSSSAAGTTAWSPRPTWRGPGGRCSCWSAAATSAARRSPARRCRASMRGCRATPTWSACCRRRIVDELGLDDPAAPARGSRRTRRCRATRRAGCSSTREARAHRGVVRRRRPATGSDRGAGSGFYAHVRPRRARACSRR